MIKRKADIISFLPIFASPMFILRVSLFIFYAPISQYNEVWRSSASHWQSEVNYPQSQPQPHSSQGENWQSQEKSPV